MAKFELILTPRAIKEIQLAIDYYNNQQAGLGKRFYSDLKQQFSSIKQNPFTIRYDDIRFANLFNFSYAAHYNIEDHLIIVQGVLSSHQDPDTSWIKKV